MFESWKQPLQKDKGGGALFGAMKMVMQTFFAGRVIRTLDCHCVMLITTPWLWILGLLSMLGKLVHLFVFRGRLPCFPYILFCFIMDKLAL